MLKPQGFQRPVKLTSRSSEAWRLGAAAKGLLNQMDDLDAADIAELRADHFRAHGQTRCVDAQGNGVPRQDL